MMQKHMLAAALLDGKLLHPFLGPPFLATHCELASGYFC